MHRRADRRGEDLRLDLLLAVRGDDVGDEAHAVLIDVVEPTGERAHDVRADRGGEQRLIDRETERDVDADAVAPERFAGGDAVRGHRYLDDHVLVPGREPAALDEHVVLALGHDLARDVAHDATDALHLLIAVWTALPHEL